MLVAFSCKQRELCPSCAAKRGTELAAFLSEHVLEDALHTQWVFTIPKMLRPLFFRRRELRGVLARLAWQTAREPMAAAVKEPRLRPGKVFVIQTFGDRPNPHPHVHALVSRRGWTRDDRFIFIPDLDPLAAQGLFRHKVFTFLLGEELITRERVELLSLLAALRLLRPQRRPPSSRGPGGRRGTRPLQDATAGQPRPSAAAARRDRGAALPEDRRRRSRLDAAGADRRPREYVARVLAQIPPPRKHLVRYHGY